jgi:triphosphoribosyl-dephospho-CoA synthase
MSVGSVDPELLANAFITACEDELRAPKPGNVHVFAPGHGMEAEHFRASAKAAAHPLMARGASVGRRIFDAVEATWASVGMNTNLGIVLLCAPIAHAALNHAAFRRNRLSADNVIDSRSIERGSSEKSDSTLSQRALTASGVDLRRRVRQTIETLNLEDAEWAFRAIVRASPAGLGAAPQHDVSAPAQASLLEAMRSAAHRDRIARQYVSGFEDIFETGSNALSEARASGCREPITTLRIYATFLSAFPDTHITRKYGEEVALKVMGEARDFLSLIKDRPDHSAIMDAALKWDSSLKERALNPGTGADLTVATLFADYAKRILANACKNG